MMKFNFFSLKICIIFINESIALEISTDYYACFMLFLLRVVAFQRGGRSDRKGDTEVVIDMSTSNKSLYLDINKIYNSLGPQISRSLAVYHIFTGNDFNPSFYRKGKKKPFNLLKKNVKFQEAFITLIQTSPSQIDSSSEVFKTIEEFVCKMYVIKSKDVNQGRYELFEKGYKSRSDTESILKKKIVGYDASCLPPTKQELLQQIKRTIYIISIWCNAFLRTPTEKDPTECGWNLIDDKYQFYWFDGPESPSIGHLYTDNQESDQSDVVDECDETWSSDENESSSEEE